MCLHGISPTVDNLRENKKKMVYFLLSAWQIFSCCFPLKNISKPGLKGFLKQAVDNCFALMYHYEGLDFSNNCGNSTMQKKKNPANAEGKEAEEGEW